MRDTVIIGEAGKPTVMVLLPAFVPDARAHAAILGAVDFRYVVYRGMQIPGLSEDKIRKEAEGILSGISDALTQPVKEEESEALKEEGGAFVAVIGEDLADVAAKVNEVFIERHWSDGLPITPPTKEAVKRMLAGTSRSPDEVVGVIQARAGIATVRMIAVNAVMAGCKPEFLPVVIAAVEAIADPKFDLYGISSTTNAVGPLLVVNGPMAEELNINCGIGLLGPCWQANMSIARAVKLVTITLGGAWPGETQMSTLGKFPFWCIAEEEKANPWEPFHVEKGFDPSSSTVTAIPVSACHGIAAGTPPHSENIIAWIGNSMAVLGPLSNHIWLSPATTGTPPKVTVLLNPLHASILAKEGWTKDGIRGALFEESKVPNSLYKKTVVPEWKKAMPAVERLALEPMVPTMAGPEHIIIIVAGAPNWGHAAYFPSWAGDAQPVTQEICGATLTKAGS